MEGQKANKQTVMSRGYWRSRRSSSAGFTLLEMLLTIGIVSLLLIVVVSVSNIANLQRNSNNQAIARQLLAEESETLRLASFLDLENRSNTPFIEVAYHQGPWQISADANAHSLPNVYEALAASGAANPSRQVVPVGSLGNGTTEAWLRVRPGSPAGWKTGMYIRYHDDQNHYLVRMTETALEFIRVIEGVPTTLWSTARSASPGTWYQVSVVATDTTFTIFLDGTNQTPTPVDDSAFSSGQFVLAAFDGATVTFDDIVVNGSVLSSWNFDVGETVGASARGWRRIGPGDLPGGATQVTISDGMLIGEDLKLIVARVIWQERGATKTLSNSFFINRQSVPE